MASNKNLLWGIFCAFGLLYIFIYMIYGFIIQSLHSSFSVISVPAIIVPFVILLLFLWIVWNKYKVKNERKFKWVFALVIVLISIPPIACAINLGINESKSKFTIEKWLNAPYERVYIVDDLIRKHELVGMTKGEVITLLGEPGDAVYSFNDKNNFEYYLGPERGFISIDGESLVIWFDEQDRVKKYEFMRG